MSIGRFERGVLDGGGAAARGRQGVPAAIAWELAASRREVAALRRENERLRAQLDALPGARAHARTGAAGVRPGWASLRCGRCGWTADAAAIAQDRTLLLASCCPRCDGPLVSARAAVAQEPSVYLG